MKQLMIAVLGIVFPAQLFAAEITNVRDFTRSVLEQVTQRTQLLTLLDMAEVSHEALREIEKDLNKRLPDQMKLPKMTLKKDVSGDVLYVDGRATALKIISYSPLKLKIDQLEWNYSTAKVVDENYFSLVQFLEGRRSFSLMDLILPQANAGLFDAFFGNGGRGLVSGGIIGALSSTLIGGPLLGATDPVTKGAIGATFGAALGYLIGSNRHDEKKAAAAAAYPGPIYYTGSAPWYARQQVQQTQQYPQYPIYAPQVPSYPMYYGTSATQ